MTEHIDGLEPLGPAEAKQMYLDQRKNEVSESTLQAHDYRLRHFVRWCDEEGIDNMNTLSGRALHRYRLWRREDGGLNNVTLVTQLSTLRVFIKWCERIDGVPEGLHDKILLPSLSKNEDRRTAKLDTNDERNSSSISESLSSQRGPMRSSRFCGTLGCESVLHMVLTLETTILRSSIWKFVTDQSRKLD
jgi:hypothetical protein